VPKQLADKDLVEVFEKGEKVVLPPWDPMVKFLFHTPLGESIFKLIFSRVLSRESFNAVDNSI
jgi:hypothetical protein